MADLKNLKKKVSTQKKKTNPKADSIDTGEASDLMNETIDTTQPEEKEKEKEKTKDLNFKVPVSFHKAFKKYAIVHDMSMKDLLEASFGYYQDQYKAK